MRNNDHRVRSCILYSYSFDHRVRSCILYSYSLFEAS